VRSFARAGLTGVRRDRRGNYRFSFQDVILLRTAKELSRASVHPRKIYRTLRTLKAQLPTGASLSALRIVVERDDVLVQGQNAFWHPESGQAQLNFSMEDIANEVAPLIRGVTPEAEQKQDVLADEWFDLGLGFETAGATEDAKAAYTRCLDLDTEYSSAHINLGRLLQDEGLLREAEAHYRRAVSFEPENAAAAFNLGTVLEALGRRHSAIEAYQQALTADPNFADAHYNLSNLYEETGNRAAALRHLLRYRALQ
jgi:tetratricopeptide (TPR) repeat protein